ncbi:hypothetical protein BH10PAT1_BH10PAT1_7040 [soil metagenome]
MITNISQTNLFVTVFVSAGTATVFVEVIFKLFLSHWLNKQFYKYKLQYQDKRGCGDEILNLINTQTNYIGEWRKIHNTKIYPLSDRLISIGKTNVSKLLDEYSNSKLRQEEFYDRIMNNIPLAPEIKSNFFEIQSEVDTLRDKLLKEVEKMKR